MQSKILSQRTLTIIIIAGFTLFLTLVFHFVLKPGFQNSGTPLSANVILSYEQERANSSDSVGRPARLKIPSIDVDSAIESVGLTSDGEMDAPPGPIDVAWFNLGPRPGENGSAVIDGHSGWKNGVKAVFNNLDKLNIGDKIYIEDENGTTTTFIVRKIRTYEPKADTSLIFGSSDGKAHLNLITCVGFWDKVNKESSNRLVVFADKE